MCEDAEVKALQILMEKGGLKWVLIRNLQHVLTAQRNLRNAHSVVMLLSPTFSTDTCS